MTPSTETARPQKATLKDVCAAAASGPQFDAALDAVAEVLALDDLRQEAAA